MNTKDIIKDLLPPILLKTKRSIFNRPQKQVSPFEELALPNQKFKDIHKGERVFILASGPSIQLQNIKPLKNEYCIAVSHFHLHDDIKTINPKYHLLAPQHPPFNFEDSSKYFIDFKNAYNEEKTQIFLGLTPYQFNYIELLKAKPEFNTPNLHYIDYSDGIQLDENNIMQNEIWDITKKPFGMRTVIYGAIQLAFYMGFKEIYLLGCDHDYLNDISRTTNHHFYKEEKGISDKNHLEQFTREKWFFEYYMRWKQYRLMSEFLNSKGIKIFNATNGGMLDVFPRINLNDLISEY